MASRIKHRVEPLFGWLFVASVVAAVALVVLAAQRPSVEVTSRFPAYEKH
jgi:hypothetical protein